MWKRANGWPQASVPGKACLQVWSPAGVWERGFGECSHHPKWAGWVPYFRLYKQAVMLSTRFPSGSPEFWHMLKWYLHHQTPTKTSGTESLMSIPDKQHLMRVVPIPCWKNSASPAGFHGARALGSGAWPPPPSLQALFPSAHFSLRPFATVKIPARSRTEC